MGPQCQIDRKNLFAIVTMCTYNLSSRNKFPNKMTFRQVGWKWSAHGKYSEKGYYEDLACSITFISFV